MGVVQALLSGNANVDAPMKDGPTALFIALQNDHLGAVHALLLGNANVDAPMNDGQQHYLLPRRKAIWV